MSTSEKIARAYGVLAAKGEKVTVRAVQREAGVRINEVAAWMREHAAGAGEDVPEAPDLSAATTALVQTIWGAAWKQAAEQANADVGEALDAARTGEAEALTAAEQAKSQRDEAVADCSRAYAASAVLRDEAKQLRDELEAARKDAAEANARALEADRGRVRAEAASDTLREVLEAFRSTPEEAGEE